MDRFLRRAQQTLHELPLSDRQGMPLATRQATADWVAYVAGRPTQWQHTLARFWRNNELFNQWVDRLVEWLADAETTGPLTTARQGAGAYGPPQQAKLLNFFNRLIADAGRYTAHGMLKGTRDLARYRASLALKVDDLRGALQNPAARPILLHRLFTLAVVHKLGFSFSHFLVNTTQTLTNTFPVLGAK
ncbi:MAG: hypothetical protein AB1505_07525 [Candidatus Latescibacterota bacterium]